MITSFMPKSTYYSMQQKPRPAVKKATTIELLRLDLHQKKDIYRAVHPEEVTVMKRKIEKHDEVTNELFNLMGAQIQKRCEERVNFCLLPNPSPQDSLTEELLSRNTRPLD